MPIIGTSQDHLSDLIAELIEKLDDKEPEPAPIINVDAPKVNVPVTVPAPVVTVSEKPSHSWTFDVVRDSNDRIVTITATPK